MGTQMRVAVFFLLASLCPHPFPALSEQACDPQLKVHPYDPLGYRLRAIVAKAFSLRRFLAAFRSPRFMSFHETSSHEPEPASGFPGRFLPRPRFISRQYHCAPTCFFGWTLFGQVTRLLTRGPWTSLRQLVLRVLRSEY